MFPALAGLLAVQAYATDPPHSTVNSCNDCHILHQAPGAQLTDVKGNGNLCISCHTTGGAAFNKPYANANEAFPWAGLPVGITAAGNSHRWDASAAGHVSFQGGATTASTGTLVPLGVFSGVYPKTYILTITTAGAVGAAQFNWTATTPGGGGASNVLTAGSVPLDQGVQVAFLNGTGTSFQVNDQWYLYSRPDLRNPTNAVMLLHTSSNVVYCSTCHDQHSQALVPYDPTAPAYGGPGTGAGRHFMRAANNAGQICLDCHASRNVTNSAAGSHPVGIGVPVDATHKAPALLPLVGGMINCFTCHKVHNAPANDGTVMRTNSVMLCVDCHTLAVTNNFTSHFNTADTNLLWPGGKWGSLMPARTDSSQRGTCLNCHALHGWPDAANPTNDYPHLLADFEENFCFDCHGTNGPAVKLVKNEFASAYHHPVVNADPLRRAGRSVECTDCHNVHTAQSGSHSYSNTATAARNTITNSPSLIGVAGVAVNYTGLTNFQAVATNLYTFIPTTTGATNEYQLCFRCHSGYAFSNNVPPAGLTPVYFTGTAAFTNGGTTVAGSGTTWTAGLTNMWLCNSNALRGVYLITAVASATSLTITPAYTGATASAQTYAISGGTDIAVDFSPWNRSGHPITTGLDNYTNSTVVGGKRGLLAAALKAPWNVNMGTQTMLCADCHNTDAAAPAAQGPHGSAFQYMLRGTNATSTGWPNATSVANSWCANCHNDVVSSVDGNHGGHHGAHCYTCHIVVPHGGKVSRLIATNLGSMPARYAWNGSLANVGLSSVKKSANNGYSESSCRTTCGQHGSQPINETW